VALLASPLPAAARPPSASLLGGTDATVAARASTRMELTFDKAAVDPNNPGVWVGTVAGDIAGTLETRLTALRVTGSIWHVSFEWIISAGEESFVATLRGTLNNETGAVVMNGTVTEGYLLGARVHEEGQLVDPSTLRFQGTIRVTDAAAGPRVGP
jgi:hypothetical protein